MGQQEEPERSHRIITPATPPKPRIWDDENAFDAFEVEDSKRNIDFMITTCHRRHSEDYLDRADHQTNHQSKKSTGSRRPKISMGHVEILMSELENSNLMKAQKGFNRFQVRCSTDDLSNLTIEEIEEHHNVASSASNKRVLNQVEPRERDLPSIHTPDYDPKPSRTWRTSSSHDSDIKPDVDKVRVKDQSTVSSIKNTLESRRPPNNLLNESSRQAPNYEIASELGSEEQKYTAPVEGIKSSSESSPSRKGSVPYDGDEDLDREEEQRFESNTHRPIRSTPSVISSTHSHSFTTTRSSNLSSHLSHPTTSHAPASSSSSNPLEPVGPGGFIRKSEEYQSVHAEESEENLEDAHLPAYNPDLKGNNYSNPISIVSPTSPCDQASREEDFSRSRSPENSHSQRSPSLVSEPQDSDLNYSLTLHDELRSMKSKGGRQHFTSTPRGVLQRPSPFPVKVPAKRAPSTSSHNQLSSNSTIVEIASVDPRAAARAAAILKVHHGFVPRGCKVENTDLIDDDELEKEMESSIRKEEADLSLRHLSFNSSAIVAPQNLLRTLQNKKLVQRHNNSGDHDQDFSSSRLTLNHIDLDHNTLSNQPESGENLRTFLTSSINTIQQESSRKIGSKQPTSRTSTINQEQHHNKDHTNRRNNRKKSLKEELKHMNYRVKFDSWTQSDWKILEYCLKKTEKERLDSFRNRTENSSDFMNVQPEDVVVRLLDALELDRSDCKFEWEWTKMIHRVIALQKRRLSEGGNSSRRSRAGSSSNGSSYRAARESNIQITKFPHNHARDRSTSPLTQLKTMRSEPAKINQTNQVEKSVDPEDSCGVKVYPSLEPIRRLFSKSRSNTPAIIEENRNNPEQSPIQSPERSTTTKIDGTRRVPKPPPISKEFLDQSLKRIQAYWSSKIKSRRRVGHGKIWKIIKQFEDRMEKDSVKLLPPPQYDTMLHYHRNHRLKKRALNSSPELAHGAQMFDHLSESSLYHPSFVHDSYSENHCLPHPSHSKKLRKS